MAKVQSEHLSAGKYHLHVWPQGKRWEFSVKAIKPSEGLFEFSGDADTLENAKRSAAARIGLTVETTKWEKIGPVTDIPD